MSARESVPPSSLTNVMMDERLIAEVEKHSVIYNRQKVEIFQGDRCTTKDSAWTEISARLGSDVDLCKKRWKYLRERYVQQKKQGDSYGYAHLSRPYLEKMKFLDQFIQPRKSYRHSSHLMPSTTDLNMLDEMDTRSNYSASLPSIATNFIPFEAMMITGNEIRSASASSSLLQNQQLPQSAQQLEQQQQQQQLIKEEHLIAANNSRHVDEANLQLSPPAQLLVTHHNSDHQPHSHSNHHAHHLHHHHNHPTSAQLQLSQQQFDNHHNDHTQQQPQSQQQQHQELLAAMANNSGSSLQSSDVPDEDTHHLPSSSSQVSTPVANTGGAASTVRVRQQFADSNAFNPHEINERKRRLRADNGFVGSRCRNSSTSPDEDDDSFEHTNNSGDQHRTPPGFLKDLMFLYHSRQMRESEYLFGELVTSELLKMPPEKKRKVQKKILEVLFFDD